MTSGPGAPSRFLPEGPASNCIIHGHYLGWTNCTPCAFAMAMDQASVNRVRLTGCDVREQTNDVAGGTTLAQNAPVAEAHGIHVEVHAGSGVVSPRYAATQLQAGRAIVLQGNTHALLNTNSQSTGNAVNHAVMLSRAKGGILGEPNQALVYDPAADGRRASWGTAVQGPQWWSWGRVLAFAAALHPWGEGDPRVLGPGKFYCAVFPDTDPHYHRTYGGAPVAPFPDRTRINVSSVWMHRLPGYGVANRTRLLHDGDLFVAYQHVVKSGTDWYGDHTGTEWVPKNRLRHVGGPS